VLDSRRFGLLIGAFLVGASAIAAAAPVWLSIWSVFLFAGPHNWMEARYLLARMPVRWTNTRAFFYTAIAGVVALSLGWVSIENRVLWHCSFFAWVLLLARLHDRRLIARWGPWILMLAGAACLMPVAADYALVYLHPLLALWFLDRQIRRSRPEWSGAWRSWLPVVPLLAALVAWSNRFGSGGVLELSLVHQAGSPAFVAVHAFLELAHYAAWIVLIPLTGLAEAPWRWNSIPLVAHKSGRPLLIRLTLWGGAALCILLWLGFSLDYQATRDLYFTVAIVHVLAEAPFLIRLRDC
jgi:hypothetical protein